MMTKEEAIHVINQVRDVITKDPSWMEEATRVVNEAADMAIKAMEAQEWIPCKDRFPGQEQRVLINLSDGDTSVGWLLRGNIWFTDYSYGKPEDEVVAWMPLPECYREGEG